MELLGKSKEELRDFCVALGEPAYRGEQIYHALYAERKFDVARMTNLPAAFREKLAKEATITLPEVRQKFVSKDGSVRFLLGLNAQEGMKWLVVPRLRSVQASGPSSEPVTSGKLGINEWRERAKEKDNAETQSAPRNAESRTETGAKRAAVEAVYMPSEGRQTICISTQAGCAVDCQFCLTAQLGLIRNLTAGEIVGQVLAALEEWPLGFARDKQVARHGGRASDLPVRQAGKWREKPGRTGDPRIAPTQSEEGATSEVSQTNEAAQSNAVQTNVVLMGQGEPLLNFENVMGALRIFLDPEGVGLSPKHVTLSTSGIVPGIERLGKEAVRPKLAISLNASNDEERDALMPINKKYPLAKLMETCRNYPLRNWEHLTFEYVMLGGVNDTDEDARRVVRLLAPLKRVKVNLIPWNPGELPFQETSEERIEAFRRILNEKGVAAFVRYSRGRDVMAACGQLALKEVTLRPLELAQGKSESRDR